MKEQDIRPKNLEIECDRLRLEDIKNFFADQKKFKKVNCPACNSADHQFNTLAEIPALSSAGMNASP